MVKSEAGMLRTRTAILDAAARILGRRPDAGMAEIAEETGVSRATLYRHFPNRELLHQGVAHAGITRLAEEFAAADLDRLPADRAMARIAAIVVRSGAAYAPVLGQSAGFCDPADVERTIQPIRKVIDRGIGDHALRGDLHPDAMFGMFTAVLERALWLTVGEVVSPEEAGDAAVSIFLHGASDREASKA